jgi:hypothetical protein
MAHTQQPASSRYARSGTRSSALVPGERVPGPVSWLGQRHSVAMDPIQRTPLAGLDAIDATGRGGNDLVRPLDTATCPGGLTP